MDFVKCSFIGLDIDKDAYYGSSSIVSSAIFYSKTQDKSELMKSFTQWLSSETQNEIFKLTERDKEEEKADLSINKDSKELIELESKRKELYRKIHAYIVLNGNTESNPYEDDLSILNLKIKDLRDKINKMFDIKDKAYHVQVNDVNLFPYKDLDLDSSYNGISLYKKIIDVVKGNYVNMGIILENVLYEFLNNKEEWKKLEVDSINTIEPGNNRDFDIITEDETKKPIMY